MKTMRKAYLILIFSVCLFLFNIDSFKAKDLDYITDGLQLLLDGQYNTSTGHTYHGLNFNDNLYNVATTLNNSSIKATIKNDGSGIANVLADYYYSLEGEYIETDLKPFDGSYTIEYVFKPDKTYCGYNKRCYIWGNSSQNSVREGFIFYDYGLIAGRENNAYLDESTAISYDDMSVSKLYYVSLVVTSDGFKEYVNGQLVKTYTGTIPTSDDTLVINKSSNSTGYNDFYTFRVYDRSLSDEEVQSNYTKDFARFGSLPVYPSTNTMNDNFYYKSTIFNHMYFNEDTFKSLNFSYSSEQVSDVINYKNNYANIKNKYWFILNNDVNNGINLYIFDSLDNITFSVDNGEIKANFSNVHRYKPRSYDTDMIDSDYSNYSVSIGWAGRLIDPSLDNYSVNTYGSANALYFSKNDHYFLFSNKTIFNKLMGKTIDGQVDDSTNMLHVDTPDIETPTSSDDHSSDGDENEIDVDNISFSDVFDLSQIKKIFRTFLYRVSDVVWEKWKWLTDLFDIMNYIAFKNPDEYVKCSTGVAWRTNTDDSNPSYAYTETKGCANFNDDIMDVYLDTNFMGINKKVNIIDTAFFVKNRSKYFPFIEFLVALYTVLSIYKTVQKGSD